MVSVVVVVSVVSVVGVVSVAGVVSVVVTNLHSHKSHLMPFDR